MFADWKSEPQFAVSELIRRSGIEGTKSSNRICSTMKSLLVGELGAQHEQHFRESASPFSRPKFYAANNDVSQEKICGSPPRTSCRTKTSYDLNPHGLEKGCPSRIHPISSFSIPTCSSENAPTSLAGRRPTDRPSDGSSGRLTD